MKFELFCESANPSFLRDKERRLGNGSGFELVLWVAVRRLQAAALVALQGGLRKHPRGQTVMD